MQRSRENKTRAREGGRQGVRQGVRVGGRESDLSIKNGMSFGVHFKKYHCNYKLHLKKENWKMAVKNYQWLHKNWKTRTKTFTSFKLRCLYNLCNKQPQIQLLESMKNHESQFITSKKQESINKNNIWPKQSLKVRSTKKKFSQCT